MPATGLITQASFLLRGRTEDGGSESHHTANLWTLCQKTCKNDLVRLPCVYQVSMGILGLKAILPT